MGNFTVFLEKLVWSYPLFYCVIDFVSLYALLYLCYLPIIFSSVVT